MSSQAAATRSGAMQPAVASFGLRENTHSSGGRSSAVQPGKWLESMRSNAPFRNQTHSKSNGSILVLQLIRHVLRSAQSQRLLWVGVFPGHCSLGWWSRHTIVLRSDAQQRTRIRSGWLGKVLILVYCMGSWRHTDTIGGLSNQMSGKDVGYDVFLEMWQIAVGK